MVEDLQQDNFRLYAPLFPVGAPAALHLSVSDADGDSAIIGAWYGGLGLAAPP